MYTRRTAALRVSQHRTTQSRDLLWVSVDGLSILNVYRAPGTDEVIDYATSLNPDPVP